MSVLTIETAEVFAPLLQPARYKGAWGGRGSGKSHFFAEMLVEDHVRFPGLRSVCIREVQKSLKESSKRLIEDKIQKLGVGKMFDVLKDEIKTPSGGAIIFQGMQDHTAESIKSLEGMDRAWVEEAQTLSQRSLSLLRPTIRKAGSEIWASWNPTRKTDAVDDFLRQKKPDDAIVVKANWRDNPWFNDVMERERQSDLRLYPDRYEHIWEGDYAKALEGAYFAAAIAEARRDGRIGHVARDPNMQVRAFWDLGRRDATAIWIAQFVGREIRVLNYCEGVGQSPGYYFNWLRSNGYEGCLCVFPHDGSRVSPENPAGVSYEDQARQAGFGVETVKNQGPSAAMQRIDAGRRLFPRIWFNEKPCQPGLDALGWYHEKRDEARNIGLGPEHDWSSHGADAFGLMCISYREPEMSSPIIHLPEFGAV